MKKKIKLKKCKHFFIVKSYSAKYNIQDLEEGLVSQEYEANEIYCCFCRKIRSV